MRPRRLSVLSLLSVGIVGTVLVVAPPATASPATAPPATASAVRITLISGDRVTVYPGDRVSVEPGPGRVGTRFLSDRIDGHLHVVPSDAVPLVRADRLDPRLFDVTLLGSLGYDDRASVLPLLMAYPDTGDRRPTTGGAATRSAAGAAAARTAAARTAAARTAAAGAAARSAAAAAGAQVTRDLPVVGALAVRASQDARTALWESLKGDSPVPDSPVAPPARTRSDRAGQPAGVGALWLDGRRSVNLDVSVSQIGAPEAWRAGLDGTGVKVAVLDSGIDATHPDLAGRVAATQNFTTDPDADDTVGHGTHVASTIVGSGAASDGRYRGVAPGATVLNGKVCVGEDCPESAILAGMQWAVQQGARIVNLSLGSADTPGIDPLEQAIDELSNRFGTLFVVAAGNNGAKGAINSPASAAAALAVGAVDRFDRLAPFSSRGRQTGGSEIKPEITAPGVSIVAAAAAHAPDLDPAALPGYTTMSGTSMAAPHVAGAAAIVAQQHPEWTGQRLKTALMASARATSAAQFGQGSGRLDVARAVSQTLAVEDGSVSFGRQRWPHTDDRPLTRTVTYRNDGPAPVTLSLAVRVAGPGGSAAPAGVVTVDPATITVPPVGTARVTLTADTSIAGPDGLYTGYLVGTAPGTQVQLPFAVEREVESYDVDLVHSTRSGRPATEATTIVLNLDTFERIEVDGAAGSAPVRLTRGAYGLVSQISEDAGRPGPADDTVTLLVQPKLVVAADTTVALDARRGRPISVRVSRRDAVPSLLGFTMYFANDKGSAAMGAGTDRLAGQYVAQIGPSGPTDGFRASIAVSLARPGPGPQRFRNSPYTYDLAWFVRGRMFTGLSRAPGFFDLAAVYASYARERVGAEGVEGVIGSLPDSGGWVSSLPFDLPFRRTKYVNTDGGVGWASVFTEQLPAPDGSLPETINTLTHPRTVYRPGRWYRQLWHSPTAADTADGPRS